MHSFYFWDDDTQTLRPAIPVIQHKLVTSTVYDDNCSYRGLAVIVQNFNETDRGIDTLKRQCNDLIESLENIENQGFDIFDDKIHDNLTCDQLYELSRRVSKINFEDHYCLLFIILTRGKPGLIRCQDEEVKYAEQSKIIENFQPQNCPSLALKPKMFIIQTLPFDPDPNQSDAMGMPDDGPRTVIKIPRESDFLIYTSDQHVYLDKNSFLESIIEHLQLSRENWLKQNSEKVRDIPEIQQLLIAMNTTFKLKHQDKKVPCTTSSLTKRMYLQRREI